MLRQEAETAKQEVEEEKKLLTALAKRRKQHQPTNSGFRVAGFSLHNP